MKLCARLVPERRLSFLTEAKFNDWNGAEMRSHLEKHLGKGGTSVPIQPQNLWRANLCGPPNAIKWSDPPRDGIWTDRSRAGAYGAYPEDGRGFAPPVAASGPITPRPPSDGPPRGASRRPNAKRAPSSDSLAASGSLSSSLPRVPLTARESYVRSAEEGSRAGARSQSPGAAKAHTHRTPRRNEETEDQRLRSGSRRRPFAQPPTPPNEVLAASGHRAASPRRRPPASPSSAGSSRAFSGRESPASSSAGALESAMLNAASPSQAEGVVSSFESIMADMDREK
ncbi:unnamed protein product, partial [Polarella glacialis]